MELVVDQSLNAIQLLVNSNVVKGGLRQNHSLWKCEGQKRESVNKIEFECGDLTTITNYSLRLHSSQYDQ